MRTLILIGLLFFISGCAWFTAEKEEKPDAEVAEKYVEQGVTYFQNSQDSLAISKWKKALEIIPKDAEIHNFIGIAYHRLANLDSAMVYFENAAALDSGYFEAINNQGYIAFLLKDYETALKSFEFALDVNPDYTPAKENINLVNSIMQGSLDLQAFNLSEQAASKEDYEEQLPLFEKALNINPEYAKAHNNLAVALFYEGNFDSAYTHLEKAVKLQPNYPEAISNLGYMNKVSQNYELAIRLFLKALTLKPNYRIALVNLGETYYLNNEILNAKRVFETVLDIFPGEPVAENFMRQINQ